MLRVINAELYRFGQSFLDELEDVDWGDDEDPRRQYKDDPKPHGQQGIIGEDAFEQFEPGTAEEASEEELGIEQAPEARDEIPMGNQALGIPEGTPEIEYDDGKQLVYDGIDASEVVSFDYTNRFGMYSGTRTVEPHYTFVASTTGNEVLVTFDRDQGDIRAFIVGNIHPYGVRYEGVQFQPHGEIMRGIY